MTNLEIIKTLKESTFTGEDKENYQLDFQYGLTSSEIEELKNRFPNNKMNNELIEILKETRGWEGPGSEMVYFDSIGEFGFCELSANAVALGNDGTGNYWILDLDENGNEGKVFFACHDPAVFIIHSQGLNEFLHHLLEYYQSPDESYFVEIQKNTVMAVWDKNIRCISKREFEMSNPEFHDFLLKFDGDDWIIADLRNGQNKDGFAWGKFGANQFTVRHPSELIWVIKNKKKGILSRLFDR